jgi:hypothetical protein
MLSQGSCFDERARLDTPVVMIALSSDVVVAGDTIAGTLHAQDASGIVQWRISALSAFDTVRIYGDGDNRAEIAEPFRLPVNDTTPGGTAIEVEVVVEDDQRFAITRRDTVVVIP